VGLPRWVGIGIALPALFAIVTGARERRLSPATTPPAHFDTAFVRANGFMMDSLRLGRLHLETAPAPAPSVAAAPAVIPAARPKPRSTPPKRDSLRYSPRGCWPE
jgi:hypothetical protein